MRTVVVAALLFGSAGAIAQVPDVRIRTDLRLNYLTPKGADSALRWYDPLGRHSLVSVEFGLEPGFRAYVSERLQRIPNNPDNDQLDEYYVEDPGLWRVGKQFLPFGKHRILRESARGAQGDTNLLFENLPISAAICDNGNGRTRGVVGRIGGRVGLSIAYGDNWGAQSTSLVHVRRPENAPGIGRGHRLVVGIDGSKRAGNVNFEAEFAVFRIGHTSNDGDTEVSDFVVTYAPHRSVMFSFGWAREWRKSENMLRAEGKFEVHRNLFVEPLVRFKDSELFDAGVSLRLRL